MSGFGFAAISAPRRVRWHDASLEPGFIGNGLHDDTPAIRLACAKALLSSLASECAVGAVYIPAGFRVTFGSQLRLTRPLILHFDSFVYSALGSDSAICLGSAKGTENSGWDVRLAGLRDVSTTRNQGAPAGVNGGGAVGLEIVGMQYSSVVVGPTQAFSRYGVFLNSSNNKFLNQHIQQNFFRFSNQGYCGVGTFAQSADAELGACQANFIQWDSLNANWTHVQFDAPGLFNTNNNICEVGAAEGTSGGEGFDIWGVNNRFELGYTASRFRLRPGSFYNEVKALNNFQNGVSFLDEGSRNSLTTGAPDASVLPAALSVLPNTATQAKFGCAVELSVKVELAAGDAAAVYAGITAEALIEIALITQPAGGKQSFNFSLAQGHWFQIGLPTTSTLAPVVVRQKP